MLGSSVDLSGQRKVYLLDDCIEVDEFTTSEVLRRRIYFDDVIALTYHRFYGWSFLLLMGIFWVLPVIGGLASLSIHEPGLAIFFFACAIPFIIPFALRLIFKIDAISVYGKRTRTEMFFSIRKARAKEVFDRLAAVIRRAQDELAAKYAAEAPPPALPAEAPPLPPPPTASNEGQ